MSEYEGTASQGEEETPAPSGEVTGEVELERSDAPQGEAECPDGFSCLWTEPDFNGIRFRSLVVPGICARMPSGVSGFAACNHSSYGIHYYENECLREPYFYLEPGQCRSRTPFPVRASRANL
jgi:hypothetical protein